jgi:hypothetical protein
MRSFNAEVAEDAEGRRDVMWPTPRVSPRPERGFVSFVLPW